MNSEPITRKQIVRFDDKRQWAIVKFARIVFPANCAVDVEYVAVIALSSETGERVTHKAVFKIIPPQVSYGRPEPATGWVIIAKVGRLEDVLGKSYAIGSVSPPAPEDVAEFSALLRS